jgi:lysophospholipase L1-like esterase
LRKIILKISIACGLFLASNLLCFALCEGNFDNDRDVDGSDFYVFVADFGRLNCDQGEVCEGNFDGDLDVDEGDLATFTADLGRIDCPFSEDFEDGSFGGWQIVDMGPLSGPSTWEVISGELRQSSNIYDGDLDPATLPKQGTFAWYEAGHGWTDYRLALTWQSTDDDAIGVMVRYQDPNNYYRFSWDKEHSYRRLVKVENGVFTLLAEDFVPYMQWRNYEIEMMVTGDTVGVVVDGEPLFGGLVIDNSTALTSGSIALYSWNNSVSVFDNIFVDRGFEIFSPTENTVVTSPIVPIPAAVDVAIQISAAGFPSNWGVEFVFDGDELSSDKVTPAPAEFIKSLAPGEHSVSVYMIDELQNRQAAYSKHVNFGVGDYYVAFGDSITFGYWHDFVSGDDVSTDGRNSGRGYPPILNDLLTAAKGYSHSVVNEGVSGDESIDGLNRLAAVLAAHPNANYFLILFGTNDSFENFPPTPSGVGLPPTDGGYPGTYKDYMQQIIDAVVLAGKTPFLAKVPLRYGNCSRHSPPDCVAFSDPSTAEENLFVRDQYNAVITELILVNGIEVTPGLLLDPPDFYSYFEDTSLDIKGKSVEFDDFLHPDGYGLQSMADLWLQALTP